MWWEDVVVVMWVLVTGWRWGGARREMWRWCGCLIILSTQLAKAVPHSVISFDVPVCVD